MRAESVCSISTLEIRQNFEEASYNLESCYRSDPRSRVVMEAERGAIPAWRLPWHKFVVPGAWPPLFFVLNSFPVSTILMLLVQTEVVGASALEVWLLLTMSAYVLKRTLKDAHSSTINAVAFSPTGLYLASGADDNTHIIWNIFGGEFIFRLKFDSPVHAILWHPKRLETLIVGCRDGGLF